MRGSLRRWRHQDRGRGSSLLVRLAGFPALLVHGDPLVLDRWLWLRRRLPRRPGALLDVGSGNGAFTIGVARLGYEALGLTFAPEEAAAATQRAAILGVAGARFEVCDVRFLAQRRELMGRFDVVVCFENIEHVLDDSGLMAAMAGVLRPGGTLLVTTPNIGYRPINRWEAGPWYPVEDGRHVRKGYTHGDLARLAHSSGLEVSELGSCSGYLSQRLAKLQWFVARHAGLHLGWLCVLPLRPLPPLVDPVIRALSHWPDYSLCLVARKPPLQEMR